MFSSIPLVFINTIQMFVDGFLYDTKETFLIEEDTEYMIN